MLSSCTHVLLSTARPVHQLCLPLPPSPIRGGLVGVRANARAAPLQSPAPATGDVQSPAPVVHAHSGMAASSAGSSGDTDWLLQTRSRQIGQRRAAGAPGAERWRTVEMAAMEAAEEWEEESGPAAARASHDVLRTDLSSSLAFHEPQADTLIVEGRPTQVIFEIHTMSSTKLLILAYRSSAVCLQSPAPAQGHVCCKCRTLESYIYIYLTNPGECLVR